MVAGQVDGVVSCFAFIAAVTQADIRTLSPRAYYNWLRSGGLCGDCHLVYGLGGMLLDRAWTLSCLDAVTSSGSIIDKHELGGLSLKDIGAGICKSEGVWVFLDLTQWLTLVDATITCNNASRIGRYTLKLQPNFTQAELSK